MKDKKKLESLGIEYIPKPVKPIYIYNQNIYYNPDDHEPA